MAAGAGPRSPWVSVRRADCRIRPVTSQPHNTPRPRARGSTVGSAHVSVPDAVLDGVPIEVDRLVPEIGAPDEARIVRRGSSQGPAPWLGRSGERGVIAAIVVAAAAGGALSDVRPTGVPIPDLVWPALLAAVVTVAATRARRTSWIVLVGIAAAMVGAPVGTVCGVLALVLAVVVSVANVRGPIIGALLGALAVQSVLRLTDFGIPRLSAAAAAVACLPVLVSGYQMATRRSRRLVRRVVVGGLVLYAVAGVAAGAAVLEARTSASLATEQTRDGLSAVKEGDTGVARDRLRLATASFDSAASTIGSPLAWPGHVLPLIGPQVTTAHELVSIGRDITATASTSLDSADYRSVRLDGGRIDVDRLAAMSAPLDAAADVLARGRRRAADVASPWEAPMLRSEADRLIGEIDGVLGPTRLAAAASRTVPGLLGADAPRRYLVLFAQPAEARGLGGFVGGYAELLATDGKVELTRSGPIDDLSEADGRNDRTLSGPPDYLARYGRFRPARFLQNVTASPDLPTVATVYRELYPKAGGNPIDGVIYVDPAGLAALLDVTGPVKVPGLDQRLTAANAADFLLRGQYDEIRDNRERDAILTAAGRATFDALLSASVPGPEHLGRVLGPAVRGGHLLVSVADTDEQAFLDSVELTGRFAVPAAGEDYLSVRVFNGNGNKIDAYLRRTIDYSATVDPGTGRVDAVATVRLVNEPAAPGVSDYVTGNNNEDPEGTNRMYVSLYSPLDLVSAERDGSPLSVEPQQEFGGNVLSSQVVIPPGGTATLQFRLSGTLASGGGYSLTVLPQALPHLDRFDLEVQAAPGTGSVAPVEVPDGVVVREGRLTYTGDLSERFRARSRIAAS